MSVNESPTTEGQAFSGVAAADLSKLCMSILFVTSFIRSLLWTGSSLLWTQVLRPYVGQCASPGKGGELVGCVRATCRVKDSLSSSEQVFLMHAPSRRGLLSG